MLKVFFRRQTAPGHERVGNADGGRATKLSLHVKFVVLIQIASLDDGKQILPMFAPVSSRQTMGDFL